MTIRISSALVAMPRRSRGRRWPIVVAVLGLGALIAWRAHADPAGGYNDPFMVRLGDGAFDLASMAQPEWIQIGDVNHVVMRIDLKAHTIWVDPKMKPTAAAKAMLRALRTTYDWCRP